MLTSSIYGQVTQAKSRYFILDGQKVLIAPAASIDSVLRRLLICDSIKSDNGYNVPIIDEMEAKLNRSSIVIAQQDSIINNLTKIVLTDSVLSEIDKSIIDKQQAQIKKEQRKVKIVGGAGIILIVLCLLL